MSTALEQPLSQKELGALAAIDLQQFEKPELHSVTDAIRAQVPHPDRPCEKWRKCLKRSDRVAEFCPISTLRKNVWRLLTITKLPSAPKTTIPKKIRHRKECFSIPVTSHTDGTLRGGLNHDGPLIPYEVPETVEPLTEHNSTILVNQLIETLFGDLRAEEVTEMWDEHDEARDLRH